MSKMLRCREWVCWSSPAGPLPARLESLSLGHAVYVSIRDHYWDMVETRGRLAVLCFFLHYLGEISGLRQAWEPLANRTGACEGAMILPSLGSLQEHTS